RPWRDRTKYTLYVLIGSDGFVGFEWYSLRINPFLNPEQFEQFGGTYEWYHPTLPSWPPAQLLWVEKAPANGRFIGIRISLLTVATAGLPLLWYRRWSLGRRVQFRLRNDLCPSCGYDLRTSPDRCPECGAIPLEKHWMAK